MELIIENGRIVRDLYTSAKLVDCDNACKTVVNNCHLTYLPTWCQKTPGLIGNYEYEQDGITYCRIALVIPLGGGRYKVIVR